MKKSERQVVIDEFDASANLKFGYLT